MYTPQYRQAKMMARIARWGKTAHRQHHMQEKGLNNLVSAGTPELRWLSS